MLGAATASTTVRLGSSAASGASGAMPNAVTAKQLSAPTTEAVRARG